MPSFSVWAPPRKGVLGEIRGPYAASRGENAPRGMPNLPYCLRAYIGGNFLPLPEDASPDALVNGAPPVIGV